MVRYVKALIMRKDEILLVKEKWGKYDLPGGHVRINENLEKAVKREVLEETGLHVRKAERKCSFTAYLVKNGRKVYKLNVHVFLIKSFSGRVKKNAKWRKLKNAKFNLKGIVLNILSGKRISSPVIVEI